MQDKNVLIISGIVNTIEKSHDVLWEQFYSIMLNTFRLSGEIDTVPIIVSEKLLFNNEITPGAFIRVNGQIRTQNKTDDSGKLKVVIYGHANDIIKITKEEFLTVKNENRIELEGYICKQPFIRETPVTSRLITDLLVACNCRYSNSYYIPCITWGINAKAAQHLRVGNKVDLIGRFQSRKYRRKYDNSAEPMRIAYEVSVSNFKIIETPKDNKSA